MQAHTHTHRHTQLKNNSELMTRDDFTHRHLLFNTNKVVDVARLGFHIKVKGSGIAGTTGKVHDDNFIKSDVQWGLVDKYEPSLQRVQQPSGCLVRTADGLRFRVAAIRDSFVGSFFSEIFLCDEVKKSEVPLPCDEVKSLNSPSLR